MSHKRETLFYFYFLDIDWSSVRVSSALIFSLLHLPLISNATELWLRSLFFQSFKKTPGYWCHSFSVLQSVKQWETNGTGTEENRLKSFSFSFVLFTHKSRRFPQSFLSFHLYLFLFSYFSRSSSHIKVKRHVSLPSAYQMLVGLKCTANSKFMFMNLFRASSSFFFF